MLNLKKKIVEFFKQFLINLGLISPVDAEDNEISHLQTENYLRTNAIKFLKSYEISKDINDLKKAKWYVNELIKHMK